MNLKRGMPLLFRKKNGQLTIFIIVAISIVAAVFLFFIIRQNLSVSQIPSNLEPAYNTFLSCLQDDISAGADILGTQGGYIELPQFVPGSAYMPFSSQLDFLGNPIPYWYYVSGNNVQKEQVPTKSGMELQLEKYVQDRIKDCKFDSYYSQGFEISLGDPKARISINDNTIELSLDENFAVKNGDSNAFVSNHKVSVNSELGGLYNSARKIYDYEQSKLFLENYGIDTIRLYAPVDGIELKCAPLTWDANEVFSKLHQAIEANTQALKVRSTVFTPTNSNSKYFISDISVPQNVRFLNSPNWSSSFEVLPSDDSLLISTPVGTQPELGILGFCYVPYHFVYSVNYPVLVQVSGKSETFQFPIAVVIQGNNPRKSLDTTAVNVEVPQLCTQKKTLVGVNVYDNKFNSIDAQISYECSGTSCSIGQTSSGKMKTAFPQCVNGFVVAKASGYETARKLYSVVDSGSVDVFMDKMHNVTVQLKLDGRDYNGQATVNFISPDGSGSSKYVVYPNQKDIQLSDGQYEIQVQMFKNSTINIAATSSQKCIDVPDSGIGGFFGVTKEKCFDINFPAQIISNALAGGGKQNQYILDSDLENSNVIEINSDSLPLPTSIQQLQNNYILFEDRGLRIAFKK